MWKIQRNSCSYRLTGPSSNGRTPVFGLKPGVLESLERSRVLYGDGAFRIFRLLRFSARFGGRRVKDVSSPLDVPVLSLSTRPQRYSRSVGG